MKSLWERYKENICVCRDIELSLDISRMRFDDGYLASMSGPIAKAFDDMQALEGGIVANPDENRRVGHYWLRAPQCAPDAETRQAIEENLANIKSFTADVHEGRIVAPNGMKYTDLLVIGIGGSALGPQWIASALSTADDKLDVHFLDNTDPEGIETTLSKIHSLATTLVIVISKSGSTPETRNGMISTAVYFEKHGLKLASQAVAITGKGSKLDKTAQSEGWIRTFPMWD